MQPEVKNLGLNLEFIRSNPQGAEQRINRWQKFLEVNKSGHPELLIVETFEEFNQWLSENPNIHVDPTVFHGKEVLNAYFYLKDQHDLVNPPQVPKEIMPQMQGINISLLPVTFALAALSKPKIIDDDSDFLKIKDKKEKEWLKNNPGKDFQTKEGLDYLYGSLDDPEAKNLKDEAIEEFRKNPKFEKRWERYEKEKEKIYKDQKKDPFLAANQLETNRETGDRFALFQKENPNLSKNELSSKYKEIYIKVEEKNLVNFALKNKKKAEVYSETNEKSEAAFQKIQKREIALEKKKKEEEEKEDKKENNNTDFDRVRRALEEEIEAPSAPEAPEAKPPSETPGQISNLRKPISPRSPSVSSSPISKIPSFSRPLTPRFNFGGLGGEAGQGLGRAGGFIGRGGGLLGRGGGLIARGGTMTAGALAGLGWPVLVGIAAVLLLTIIILIIGGGMAEIPSSPGGPGGDVAGCTFYRGGDKEPGMKFGNPQMASLISEISGKVGVPSSVIAGIMRVETSSAVSSTDQTYLINDYDMHCSIEGWNKKDPPTLEECRSSGIAFGVMQFTPDTFIGTYKVNSVDLKSIFGKTDLKTTLDPQDSMAPENIFRIYSIKDSITAAAYKVKNDKYYINKDRPWDESTIREIAYRYYGTNKDYDSNGNNYGTDLWKSFQNCQTSIPGKNVPVSPDGIHACVTSENFIPFPGNYSNINRGQYSYVCGHCSPIYNAIDTGVNSEGGSPVAAVTDGVVEDNTNPVGGTALWLTGDDNLNYYYAHLKKDGLVTGRVKAGQIVGYIASARETTSGNNGIAHVHFSAGTPGNKQSFNDPANVPAGQLLDNWCGNNVCSGKPNANYNCGQF